MFLHNVPVATMNDIAWELGVARRTVDRWCLKHNMPYAIWKGTPTRPKSAVIGIPRSCAGGRYSVLFHRPQVALWLRNDWMQWNQTKITKRLMDRFIRAHLDNWTRPL